MIQATKAIVLKTIKYGETSLIVTLYTELFGIQSCIVNGVRKSTKKVPAKSNYFLIGNILQVSLYYQANKKLQRISDYQFDKVHTKINNSIVKSAIIFLMMEVVHHTIWEPEPNPDLFEWFITHITYVENATEMHLTWMPHYFCIQYASLLGFGIQGRFNLDTPILHLLDGEFIAETNESNTNYCLQPQSQIIDALHHASLENLHILSIASTNKRFVLRDVIIYFQLHIAQMQTIKSIAILESVFE